MPSRLSRFWQELKRRNVVRVITVYAGAAFVIIELINNITEPLRLPDWTPTFVIVLLAIGFPIAIIFSWIYDIHPEGGIVKTEPAHKVKAGEMPKSSNSWKIASYISFVVIVGLIVLNVIPRTGREKVSEVLDKSIAVLPFQNDSPNQEMYFMNGVMEEILDNLSKIQDLRVVSRSSVEQYRDEPKPIPVVAEEMDVGYVLEGSGQRDGDNIRLTVQLLDARKDQHIWSESYYREIENIFELQSEIAQLVAGEIKAVITPEEKDLIEKVPTPSLTAHDFYQRGREEYWNENTDRAGELYNEALRYDSTYAPAIIGLASVYWDRNYWKEYYTESFMDSAMLLVDRALSFDPQLSEAYVLRGQYYYRIGQVDASIDTYNKALSLNPNDWTAYMALGEIYSENDIIRSIQNYQKAISLNKEPEALPGLLRNLAGVYGNGGFFEKRDAYRSEAFKLDKDSVIFYNNLMTDEFWVLNLEKGLEYAKRAFALDSSNRTTLMFLPEFYALMGYNEESMCYLSKYLDRLKELEILRINDRHRVAYIYWLNGMAEEADQYFDQQVVYCTQDIELNRPNATEKSSYYDLACVYAFKGETNKALEYLRVFNQKEVMTNFLKNLIGYDPLMDNLRGEPEFQQIVRDVEAKYQAEHERVRQWLEENEML